MFILSKVQPSSGPGFLTFPLLITTLLFPQRSFSLSSPPLPSRTCLSASVPTDFLLDATSYSWIGMSAVREGRTMEWLREENACGQCGGGGGREDGREVICVGQRRRGRWKGKGDRLLWWCFHHGVVDVLVMCELLAQLGLSHICALVGSSLIGV